MSPDGYLRDVLADGGRPFRHRARVRALLGLPADGAVPVSYAGPAPRPGFRYVREPRAATMPHRWDETPAGGTRWWDQAAAAPDTVDRTSRDRTSRAGAPAPAEPSGAAAPGVTSPPAPAQPVRPVAVVVPGPTVAVPGAVRPAEEQQTHDVLPAGEARPAAAPAQVVIAEPTAPSTRSDRPPRAAVAAARIEPVIGPATLPPFPDPGPAGRAAVGSEEAAGSEEVAGDGAVDTGPAGSRSVDGGSPVVRSAREVRHVRPAATGPRESAVVNPAPSGEGAARGQWPTVPMPVSGARRPPPPHALAPPAGTLAHRPVRSAVAAGPDAPTLAETPDLPYLRSVPRREPPPPQPPEPPSPAPVAPQPAVVRQQPVAARAPAGPAAFWERRHLGRLRARMLR